MDPPPALTSHYRESLRRHKDAIHQVLATSDAILRSVTLSDLKEHYGPDGTAIGDDLNGVWGQQRDRLAFIGDLNPVFLAGLGNKHYAADFGYWGRMEGLKIDETLWLCVGLDPRADWINALRLNQSIPNREHRERTYMLSIQEQLARAARSISANPVTFNGPELLEWMRATEFPAHPGFLRCLAKIAGRRRSTDNVATVGEASGKEDPREIASIARILTAIAIREYGYRPGSNKSPIPKEIQAICDEEGLPVSRETILKYLRFGARQRSEDG